MNPIEGHPVFPECPMSYSTRRKYEDSIREHNQRILCPYVTTPKHYSGMRLLKNSKRENDNKKIGICAQNQIGQCRDGEKCVYAHDLSELREDIQSRMKTKLCRDGDDCLKLKINICTFFHREKDFINEVTKQDVDEFEQEMKDSRIFETANRKKQMMNRSTGQPTANSSLAHNFHDLNLSGNDTMTIEWLEPGKIAALFYNNRQKHNAALKQGATASCQVAETDQKTGLEGSADSYGVSVSGCDVYEEENELGIHLLNPTNDQKLNLEKIVRRPLSPIGAKD